MAENTLLLQSEIQLQAQIFQFVWNNYPLTRRCLFHVPNGGRRSKVEAAQLKASGVVSGIPDLILVWKGRVYGFELKTPTGILSDAQREVHAAWHGQDVQVWVIRTFAEFLSIFTQILNRA